jgi:IS30 family transposase
MTKKYSRLSFSERIIIEKLLSHRKTYTYIAAVLNRHKSTIQRDVSKQGRKKYTAIQAEKIAVGFSSNRKAGKSKINCCAPLLEFVHQKLGCRWSPRQISMELKKLYSAKEEMQISHEAIYLYIYIRPKNELNIMLMNQLRQKRKFRGNVRRGADKRTTIKDPIRIDERPKEVLGREIPGHWEGDLIIGKDHNSAIGTLVERTTRTIIMVHLKARDATSVRKAFEKEFKNIPAAMKLTMTYDNGSEMAQHKLFTKNTKIAVYFAHPYSPWERPTNENSNGLIRDYYPKGTDFSLITKKELKRVQNELNERPRNVLNWRTPKEVFEEMILQKMEDVLVN